MSDPASQPAVTPAALKTPSLARRMGCWLYEGMLLFAVVFAAAGAFSTLGRMRDAMDPRRPLLQVFLFLVFGIYFTWFWAKGQTLAMKTWKISVVDRAGRPLSQSRALVRYVCSWLWFLPSLAVLTVVRPGGGWMMLVMLGWVALWALLSRLHSQRQFWHDALAGTRLVESRPPDR